jgi:chitin elicitor receptor kinase 1
MALRALLTRLLLLAAAASAAAGDGCRLSGCSALASYLIDRNQNLTYIASLFGFSDYHELAAFNPGVKNMDSIVAGQSLNISFPCNCQTLAKSPFSSYLAGSFSYKVVSGDIYSSIAAKFNGLTTADWLDKANSYPSNNIPDTGTVNVTVNCSCGDPGISKDYGLFLTYPLTDGQTLASVAANYSFGSQEQLVLLNKYNPGIATNTTRLAFIPVNGEHFQLFVGL